MVIFEAIMIFCFGISWPFSIYRTYTTKTVSGKSLPFLLFVFVGYLAGIMYKVTGSMDNVIILYIFNTLLVGVDILLYLKYARKKT